MGKQICGHFDARATGTIEARELRDGRWQYSTAYVCSQCGSRFVETHIGAVGLAARIDAAFAEVRRLREIVEGPKTSA